MVTGHLGSIIVINSRTLFAISSDQVGSQKAIYLVLWGMWKSYFSITLLPDFLHAKKHMGDQNREYMEAYGMTFKRNFDI